MAASRPGARDCRRRRDGDDKRRATARCDVREPDAAPVSDRPARRNRAQRTRRRTNVLASSPLGSSILPTRRPLRSSRIDHGDARERGRALACSPAPPRASRASSRDGSRGRGRPRRAPPAIGRRAGLVGGLGAGLAAPWLPFASPDAAAKLDVVYEGVPTTAYTFPVPLNVVALRGSVGSQWDAEFNKILVGKGKVSVVAVPAPGDVYADLLASAPPPPTPQTIPPAGSFAPPTPEQIAERRRQTKTSKKKAPSGKTAKADVVSLGDEFLAPAIAAGLILPLDRTAPASEWYARTPPNWRRVVSRDANGRFIPPPAPSRLSRGFPNVGAATHPADASTVYGVPYRWGCQLIAYRVDKLPASMRDRPPRDWSDLWRPEFAKRVALPGGPRAMLTAATRARASPRTPRTGSRTASGTVWRGYDANSCWCKTTWSTRRR